MAVSYHILNDVVQYPHIAVRIEPYPDRLLGDIDAVIELPVLKNRYPVYQDISRQLCRFNRFRLQRKLIGI